MLTSSWPLICKHEDTTNQFPVKLPPQADGAEHEPPATEASPAALFWAPATPLVPVLLPPPAFEAPAAPSTRPPSSTIDLPPHATDNSPISVPSPTPRHDLELSALTR